MVSSCLMCMERQTEGTEKMKGHTMRLQRLKTDCNAVYKLDAFKMRLLRFYIISLSFRLIVMQIL
jgi:hypothetical protein